jgi:hypothetical protein
MGGLIGSESSRRGQVGTGVSFAGRLMDLSLLSANLSPAFLADSTTLGFAISATTLASTAAGDGLKLFTNIDQSSQNGRNYTVHF